MNLAITGKLPIRFWLSLLSDQIFVLKQVNSVKAIQRITTATIMALALIPPGWYIEALASPPMPYLAAVDYVVEGTPVWAEAVTDTDHAFHDLDDAAVRDWDGFAAQMERSP